MSLQKLPFKKLFPLKTVLIIPLGNGSKWDNNELRFALRSIDKHLTGFDEVMIVGDRFPSWLTGVDLVTFGDISKFPAINTLEKVKQALRYTNADQFLLSYDDVFLNKNYRAGNFPSYYNGDLKQIIRLRGNYKESCILTYQMLFQTGCTTKKFGVHCPFLFETKEFIQVVSKYKNQEPGYLYKSLYANAIGLVGQPFKDIIVNLPLNLPGKIETLPFFSIRDGAVNFIMKNFFEEQFPNKSQFEK